MSERTVKIRMYKQGLGDCFLLIFPRDPKPFYLLLDCGALNSKHYNADLMKAVVQDIADTTEGKLDVLAATHEHWDHISGFHKSQAQTIFEGIKVDRVWIAWTEDKENETAQELKKTFGKHKEAVGMAINRLPADQPEKSQLGMYRNAVLEHFGFFGGLGAAGENKTGDAWNYILSKGRNVYCDPKKKPIELKDVEGVRVYVLGPPTDLALIKKRLPGKNKETYEGFTPAFSRFDSFLSALSTESDPLNKLRACPFDDRYRVEPNNAHQEEFYRNHYGFSGTDQGAEWQRIDHDWLSVAGELALHLDSYTNNTCLAFAIELIDSGKVLLFPGDAQVGNWLSWGNQSWKVKDVNGNLQKVSIDDLLPRTVFYKVGHHGSHNATLRERGLEKMDNPDLVAMIPIHRATAEDQHWEFPYPPLYKRLCEKARGRVLLADAKDRKELTKEAKKILSEEELSAFDESITFEKLYVEFSIPY
jgi:hypothetical protein